MGGIKLLVDLYWLTWLRARVFAGLICVLLRWGLSCSSVNHVFSDRDKKRRRRRDMINATWKSVTLSVLAHVLS